MDSMRAWPVRARATMRVGLFAIGGQSHGHLDGSLSTALAKPRALIFALVCRRRA